MPRKSDPLLSLPDKSGVLYVRIYQRLRALVLEGHWPAGTRLPSSRQLAVDLRISRNTAILAIEQLVADGLAESRSRAGVFVSAEASSIAIAPRGAPSRTKVGKPPIPFELTPGAMDSFPFGRWSKIQSQVWSGSVPHILYDADRAGDRGLRVAIASVIAPVRGMSVDPDQIIIVDGTQAATNLLAATIGSGPAVVEDPAHLASHATLAARGMDLTHVRVDESGLDVEAARRLCPNPKLIVASPALQFPTCVSMSNARRKLLLAWAEESGAWVMEDDYDADARFDGSAPPPPLREDRPTRVITIVTFNRLLYRSLRLGFIVMPEPLLGKALSIRRATDEFVGLPNQLVLRRFIEDGGFTAHLRRLRELHHERRAALLEALLPFEGSLLQPGFNASGLHLIARPIGPSAGAMAAALHKAGVACFTLADLSKLPEPPEGVLLGFSAFSPDVIRAMHPTIMRTLEGLLPSGRERRV